MGVRVMPYRRGECTYAFCAQYAAKIHIEPTYFDGDVEDFPYLLCSDSDSTLTDYLLNPSSGKNCIDGGGDLRVCLNPYDASSRVGIEVVECKVSNTSSEQLLHLWLEAGSISGSSGKDIYLLWGIEGATQPARDAEYGSEVVWAQYEEPVPPDGEDYRVVCHMDGSGNTLNDSTPYQNSITKTSAGPPLTTPSSEKPFKGGFARDFRSISATERWIDVAHNSSLNTAGQKTYLHVLLKRYTNPEYGNYDRIVSKKGNYSDTNGWETQFRDQSFDTNEILGSSGTASELGPYPFNWNDANWHSLQFNVNESGDVYGAVDGVFYSGSGQVAPIVNNTERICFGTTSYHGGQWYDGFMAEVRVVGNNFNIVDMKAFHHNIASTGTFQTVTHLPDASIF